MTTLALLRDLYRDETSGVEHLTASAPPVVRQVIERAKGYDLVEEQEPADRIGRSLSAAMVTLIGGVEEDGAAYGPRYPLRRALAEFDRMCRRRHRLPSWTDHARPVCSMMLYAIVQDGATILWCSTEYEVSYARAERLVDSGATFVWNRIVHWDHLRAEITLDPDCVMCTTRKAPFHLDEGDTVPLNVIHLDPAM